MGPQVERAPIDGHVIEIPAEVGQPVVPASSYGSGTEVTGELIEISLRSRSVNNATVFGVKLEAEPPPGLTLRSGYSAVARIELARADDVLVLPERLIDYRNGTAFVLTDAGGGGFLEKEIGVGLSDGITVEITEGLVEGDGVLERVF